MFIVGLLPWFCQHAGASLLRVYAPSCGLHVQCEKRGSMSKQYKSIRVGDIDINYEIVDYTAPGRARIERRGFADRAMMRLSRRPARADRGGGGCQGGRGRSRGVCG